MAVVQISKIQVRRGLKNNNNGIPQLSSGEIAWAIDSQELFIGNGSVAEGAPYVGNTKIVTENDNLLELAASYQYGRNVSGISLSTSRSLQNKLDEYVSVADFGAVNDGSTDSTQAFENAFTQLFRSTNTDLRKVLIVPNGEYLFTQTLNIPSNVILRGETEQNTFLRFGGNSVFFITEDGDELADFTSSNIPNNVQISNLTLDFAGGQMNLSGLQNSKFENVTFESNYTLGNTVGSIESRFGMLNWTNELVGVSVTDIFFGSCTFKDSELAIKVTQTDNFQTRLNFESCNFTNLHDGVYVNGVTGQTNNWIFDHCTFEEIHTRAINFNAGGGTTIRTTDFRNCGNGTQSAANPISEIVYFGDTLENVMYNCTSNRVENAGLTTGEATGAVAEVIGSSFAEFSNVIKTEVFLDPSPRPFLALGADNGYIYVDYTLTLNTSVRRGRLTIMTVEDNNVVSISDDYDYVIEGGSSPTIFTNFEFSATLRNNIADDSSRQDTILLTYRNPLSSALPGTLAFSVTYGG